MNRLRLALLCSLGVNLLLAAFISMHVFRMGHGPHGRGPDGHGAGQMLDHIADMMDPPDAAILRGSLSAHRAEIVQIEARLGGDMEAVRAALLATPFNPAQLRGAMLAVHDERQRLGPAIGNVILDAAPNLSGEGRKHLADLHGR